MRDLTKTPGYHPCADFDHKAIARNCQRIHTSYLVMNDGYITETDGRIREGAYAGDYFCPIYLKKGSVFRIKSIRGMSCLPAPPAPNSIILLNYFEAQQLIEDR